MGHLAASGDARRTQRRLAARGVMALLALAVVSCSQVRHVKPERLHVYAPAPPEVLFEHVLSAVRAEGYWTTAIQPRRLRFVARARYDDATGAHVFAVECGTNGWCRVMPIGPRVEHFQGRIWLPLALRRELERLVSTVEHAAQRATSQARQMTVTSDARFQH